MFQFDLYFSDGLKAPSIENYLVSRSSFFLAGPFTCYQRRTVNILGRVPPRKLTWQWNITIFNRKYIFKWLVFHCYAWFSGVYSFWVMLWQGRFFAQIFWQFHFRSLKKEWSLAGSSQDSDTWLITMVIISPLRIGLWDPMAFLYLFIANKWGWS